MNFFKMSVLSFLVFISNINIGHSQIGCCSAQAGESHNTCISLTEENCNVAYLTINFPFSQAWSSASWDGTMVCIGEGQNGSSCSVALPVEFIHFTTEKKHDGISLIWKTGSENNNRGFEIQRSLDGNRFSNVGWVESNGNTNSSLEYKFIDRSIELNTIYYYRLKQYDYDGNYSYSDIQTEEMTNSINRVSKLFPNPSNGSTFLNINSVETNVVDIEVYSNYEIVLQSENHLVSKGDNEIEILTNNLAKGIYFVKIFLQNEVFYKKLIKI